MSRCQDVKRGRGQGVKGRVLDEPFFKIWRPKFVLVLFYNLATYIKVVGNNKHKFVQKVAKDYILIYFVSFVVCHMFFGKFLAAQLYWLSLYIKSCLVQVWFGRFKTNMVQTLHIHCSYKMTMALKCILKKWCISVNIEQC